VRKIEVRKTPSKGLNMGVVVVGVDRSGTSTKALHEAIREATWRGSTVLVGYVVQRPVYATVELGAAMVDALDVEAVGREAIASYLAEVEASFDGGFPVPLESEVLVGHAGNQILELARRHDAELIVLGSRGFGGVKGLLLGSVTTYAVHHVKRPLLVVPGDTDGDDTA